ncbi:MAG TPA: DinB family protein [bacterium]
MDAYDWLIEHVDRTYQKGNWAGTGVRPALEGVSAELAAWRPHPEQHTIAEIALHMAYWKDAVGARLAERPWTYDEEQNWRTVPATQGWTRVASELQAAHERLMSDLRALSGTRLMAPVGPTPGGPTRELRAIDLVVDIATHDHYHAAQIFVLKRLHGGPGGAAA